jgi:hypothetical protein
MTWESVAAEECTALGASHEVFETHTSREIASDRFRAATVQKFGSAAECRPVIVHSWALLSETIPDVVEFHRTHARRDC